MKLLACTKALVALLSIGGVSCMKSSGSRTLKLDGDFNAASKAGRDLLAAATVDTDGSSRTLEDEYDSSFIGEYSVKFQDCHSVSQWNGDYEEGSDDERILTERLVRFRLCPSGSCTDKNKSGCSSKYGDFLVDLNTFVYYYLSAQEERNSDIYSHCNNACADEEDDGGSCEEKCYSDNGYYERSVYDDDGVAFDPYEYSQCSLYNDHYIGPYCSSDGGSVHLGIFSDDACTQVSSCDSSCFSSAYGINLPFADSSLVETTCVPCSYNYFAQSDDDSGNYGTTAACQGLYEGAGKCETKMYIDYPNESACKYIEGIKYLGNNGVISSNSIRPSKAAGMMVGVLLTAAVLLATYVHYLNTKLARARFNLTTNAGDAVL